MAAIIVAGFSMQLAMGRSSFAAPPMVHGHALLFFGWTTLYVLQNLFVTRGTMALHRTLGWIAAPWAAAMIVMGLYVTVAMTRRGTTPFFFQPAYFLVMNSLSIIAFGAFTASAILLRRRTEWHRRLHLCGMATLTGPAFGRLLPMPLLIPWAGWAVFAATLLFPVVGMVRDARRHGAVHPAWWWGAGGMVLMQFAIALLGLGATGAAIHHGVTAGSPGAGVAPLAFPAPPGRPLVTGRTAR